MKCSKCTKSSICDIIAELRKVFEELKEIKEGNTLTVKLNDNPKLAIEDAKKKYRELRTKFYQLRERQSKCQRRRLILYYKGYTVFKRKKHPSK